MKMSIRDVVVAILVILLVLGLYLGDSSSPPPVVESPSPATISPSVAPTPLSGEVGTWWEREKEKNRKSQQRK